MCCHVLPRVAWQMITEETFAMTHPWHLEEWYARRRRYRRQARAAAQYVASSTPRTLPLATLSAHTHIAHACCNAAVFGTRGTTYADIGADYMDPDVATYAEGMSSPSDLVAAKEAQLAQLAPGEPPSLELLEGFDDAFPVNADNRWVKPRVFDALIEQDDDMLDGFGSDWEEDVPVADWFSMGQRAHSTGLQLEELYFQESMVDIKKRLDEFAKAHRSAYTPEVRPRPFTRPRTLAHSPDVVLHCFLFADTLRAPVPLCCAAGPVRPRACGPHAALAARLRQRGDACA